MTFSHRVTLQNLSNATQNSEIFGNLNNDELFRDIMQDNPSDSAFRISFGSQEIPRFNCDCHKLNLVIR